ncbi:MAG: hypothetical protein MJ239_05245 [Bacilli bacterium]|nr:hypothetical protein [Bacilli bacterium]
MKGAAKVFIVLGMIFQFYLIYPLIIGGIALNKLSNAKRKSELIGIGIVSLIFVSTLGGIFILCVRPSDFAPDSGNEERANRGRDDENQSEGIIHKAACDYKGGAK